MAGVTEELRVLVEAEVERAIAQFQKLDKTVEKNEKQTQKLGDALDALSRKSMVVSAAFGGAGIASIKFAGELEKTQKSLEVLLRDAEKATKIKDEWVSLAAETPFQTEDIDKAGKMLLAFGVGADKVTDSLRQIGDISAATGSSISELADLYGKAKVQGRLFAQDINQFQGRGIPVAQALAKQLGVAESSIRQMVEAGKIGFPEIEKAFKSMTGPGGQFAGMMEELAKTTLGKFSTATDNAKLAIASFGEVLLPVANDVLDAATSVFASIQEMDDGAKRFIITFGGIVTASGPIIFALHGINVAMAAIAANPAFLVIAGSVVAIGLAAGAISKYKNEYDDLTKALNKNNSAAQSVLEIYAQGDTSKKLDKKATEDLIKIYPELKGKINEYATSVEDAATAVQNLVNQKLIDAQSSGISSYLKKMDEIASLQIKIDKYKLSGNKMDVGAAKDMEAQVSAMQNMLDVQRGRINERLQNIGKELTASGTLVDIKVAIKPQIDDSNLDPSDDVKKKWQLWVEDITKISEKDFGCSGKKAGELFLNELDNALQNQQLISESLGNLFDVDTALESKKDAIQSAMLDLISIAPKNIDQMFTLVLDEAGKIIADKSSRIFEPLVSAYNETQEALNKNTVTSELDKLRQTIENLGKTADQVKLDELAKIATPEDVATAKALMDEYARTNILKEWAEKAAEVGKNQKELVIAQFESTGATQEQIAALSEYIDKVTEASEANRDWAQVFRDEMTSGLLDTWPQMSEAAATAFADIGLSLAKLSFDGILSGLDQIGAALAQNDDIAGTFGDAIGQMSLRILDALPQLFLQAGLQMVATPGMWALGLGLIAAAGVTAVTGGFVKGTIEKDKNTENAHGGVYDGSGITPFAKGGSFSNSIVDSPTFFKFAKGTGLMGEAGPEAIMPLRRGSNGDLGVSLFGTSANENPTVIINIINNTGEAVEQKESSNSNGQKEIEIIIGQQVGGLIDRGKFDGNLKSRYGLKVQGV